MQIYLIVLASIQWAFPPCHAATFTVSSQADDGDGSLRVAITSANTAASVDVIRFTFGGTGRVELRLLSPLPAITDAVIIDGLLQDTVRVVVNAETLSLITPGPANSRDALVVRANNVTIRGLAFMSSPTSGINLESGANFLVERSVVFNNTESGINLRGTVATGKPQTAMDAVIRSCLVYGNGAEGVRVAIPRSSIQVCRLSPPTPADTRVMFVHVHSTCHRTLTRSAKKPPPPLRLSPPYIIPRI